jgi:aminoglycoside 6-adenylyltransferase
VGMTPAEFALQLEDPDELLARILAFADRTTGIDAVVQTGSRARRHRVDAFSDLDIELIGPGSAALVGRDDWPEQIAPTLVSLHLANEQDDAPDWPTCLVVFAGGRKVDFMLAGPERLDQMARDGLDEYYRRGYLVHRDRTGATAALPPSNPVVPAWVPPTAEAFQTTQREFWFEATQVPVYLARGDLWPAMLRLHAMRTLLLTMLEWRTHALLGEQVDTWHNGHHIDEWLDPSLAERLGELFATRDPEDGARALRACVSLYADVARDVATALALPHLGLAARIDAHISRVLAY